MASKSSKTLPFLVLAALIALAVYETETGRDVPLGDIQPVLLAIGVGGVPLAAVKAIAANKGAVKAAVQKFKEGDKAEPS